MSDDRLIDIEMRLAYQDDSIQALSDTIYQQQKEINLLNKQLAVLIKRFQDVRDNDSEKFITDERPPHY